MFNYYPQELINKLNDSNIFVQYAKIIILSFDEKPIKEIQGTITTGSLSVNGSSAVRRTINLTMSTIQDDLENLDYIISVNKKIKVFIGYKNTIDDNYDKIIWFPCGLFYINNPSSTRSISGWTITFTGQDKMVTLNGTVGGVLPASVTFNETYVYDESGDIIGVEPITFNQMIREAVIHFGGMDVNKVFVNDVPETAKLLMRWVGDTPLYINEETGQLSTNSSLVGQQGYVEYYSGQDVGYRETPFTSVSELTLKPGDTVVTLLDKIVQMLGNFEYFFDLDGNFIFQQKRNFLDIQSPLLELKLSDYFKEYSNEEVIASFVNSKNLTQIQKNVNYQNLKNEFIIWGKREAASGAEIDIRYHLVIDDKPSIELANQYMWALRQNNTIVRYEFTYNSGAPSASGYEVILVGKPCQEWREELYRRALVAQITNGQYSYYDAELIAEWRKLYDTLNPDWQDGWNPIVTGANKQWHLLDYWLDFIDLPQYSVNAIGRRQIVQVDQDVKTIMRQDPPDVMFLTAEEYAEHNAEYRAIGQVCCQIPEDNLQGRAIWNSLVVSSSGVSAFDKIREQLYQHLSYNTTLTLTCLPRYDLEPNCLIYINDKTSNINGYYVITQFNLPLTYNGTMSITATEALTRI